MHQTIYAYYKSREAGWTLLGTYVDPQVAMESVQAAVSKLRLRCIFRWNDAGEYTCGEKESSVFGKLLAHPMGQGGTTESEERAAYNLHRPPHLIAGQVLRDMEVIANVKFGPLSSEPVHRLAEQYQILLLDQDQKILELEARLKLIEQRFDRYCHDGLELGGFTHLPLQVPEAQRLLFDSLSEAIKDVPRTDQTKDLK